jgi:hypothetical protein
MKTLKSNNSLINRYENYSQCHTNSIYEPRLILTYSRILKSLNIKLNLILSNKQFLFSIKLISKNWVNCKLVIFFHKGNLDTSEYYLTMMKRTVYFDLKVLKTDGLFSIIIFEIKQISMLEQRQFSRRKAKSILY